MVRLALTAICVVAPLHLAIAGDLFAQPKQLCSALSADGLVTQGWKVSKAIPGEWLCMTSLIPFGGVGPNGMENNIAFAADGTSATRANEIRLKININNPAEQKQSFVRLGEATRSLFAAFSGSPPEALMKAIV